MSSWMKLARQRAGGAIVKPKLPAGLLAVPGVVPGRRSPKAGMQALGRLKTGERNQMEAAYERTLELRLERREVLWFEFEAIKLRLADNTFYSPDFAVLAADFVLEMHEVKGRWEDDARVKIKVAASLFPFRFVAIRRALVRDGGGWIQEHF